MRILSIQVGSRIIGISSQCIYTNSAIVSLDIIVQEVVTTNVQFALLVLIHQIR